MWRLGDWLGSKCKCKCFAAFSLRTESLTLFCIYGDCNAILLFTSRKTYVWSYINTNDLLNRAAVGWAVSCSAFGIFGIFFSFVGEQTQTPTRPLLSPDDVIISQLQAISQLFSSYPPPPPLRSILSIFRQNMAVCEKCLFGQNWAKHRWRCTSGHLQG